MGLGLSSKGRGFCFCLPHFQFRVKQKRLRVEPPNKSTTVEPLRGAVMNSLIPTIHHVLSVPRIAVTALYARLMLSSTKPYFNYFGLSQTRADKGYMSNSCLWKKDVGHWSLKKAFGIALSVLCACTKPHPHLRPKRVPPRRLRNATPFPAMGEYSHPHPSQNSTQKHLDLCDKSSGLITEFPRRIDALLHHQQQIPILGMSPTLYHECTYSRTVQYYLGNL